MSDRKVQVLLVDDTHNGKLWVRMTKLGVAPDPKAKTPDMKDFVPGQDNGNVSLPVEYWAEGILVQPPKVGSSLVMMRYIRNGVHVQGLLSTSPIKKIEGDMVFTENSQYKLEEKPMPEEYVKKPAGKVS